MSEQRGREGQEGREPGTWISYGRPGQGRYARRGFAAQQRREAAYWAAKQEPCLCMLLT